MIDIATDFAISLGKRDRDHLLSLQWYSSFMGRWPDLKVLKPRGLQIQRAMATSVESITRYFTELESILKKYDLLDKPERIFNVDEKGISTSHKPPNVVCEVGTKPPSVTSASRTNVTVIGCGNALGHQVPPYLIFPGVRMRGELLEGKTVGADGTVTESGWCNSDVFHEYLVSHMIKYLPERSPQSPVLVMYDGHKSHVSINLIDWAKEENIILFVLPAHTSHILQPMDVGCFGPFESIYNNIAHKYMREHCGISITRNNICSIACKAYTKALSPENLQNSFRKAGICPFNPDIVDRSSFLPATVLEQEKSCSSEARDDQTTTDIPCPEPLPAVEASEPGSGAAKDLELNFFENKEREIRKKKSQTKKRRYLSYIVSGKAITEDKIVKEIHEHQEKVSKKPKSAKVKSAKVTKMNLKANKGNSKSNKLGSKSGSTSAKLSGARNDKVREASPLPGPSHINLADSEDFTDESVDEDDEKCCVCNKFTPDEVRQSISLVFTKWAQCDFCSHWVHLIYCTEVRFIRFGDKFACPHCKDKLL